MIQNRKRRLKQPQTAVKKDNILKHRSLWSRDNTTWNNVPAFICLFKIRYKGDGEVIENKLKSKNKSYREYVEEQE